MNSTTTWTVIESKIFQNEQREWVTEERVIATGLSRPKADSLLNHDRYAVPEKN